MIDVLRWLAWCGVAVVVFEERSNALVDLTCHDRCVVLAVDGVLATRRQMLVICVDAGALLIELWQNIGNVGGEAPWLLEEVVW